MSFLNSRQSVRAKTHHILENEISIRKEKYDYINIEGKSFIPHFVKKVNQIHIFKLCYPLIFCFIFLESAEFHRVQICIHYSRENLIRYIPGSQTTDRLISKGNLHSTDKTHSN